MNETYIFVLPEAGPKALISGPIRAKEAKVILRFLMYGARKVLAFRQGDGGRLEPVEVWEVLRGAS